MKLHRASPVPKKDDPIRITLLAPKRSTIPPTKGPMRLWIIIQSEKAPAAMDRLQPNSFKRATKKTENEYQTPYVRERVIKLTPTMIQPNCQEFLSFIDDFMFLEPKLVDPWSYVNQKKETDV